MDIEVRVSFDQWEEYCHLVTRYQEGELHEEEFAEKLYAILGKSPNYQKPQEGDTLRLVLAAKPQVIVH
jgi:hypothetical protein